MNNLEAIYLANVVNYLPSLNCIAQFKMINKKCDEATKIVRFYDKKSLLKDVFTSTYLFDVLPNIETFVCRLSDIELLKQINQGIKQIKLIINNESNIFIPQEIKNKVVDLELFCVSLKEMNSQEFPNLKRIKISFCIGNVKEFLGDNKLPLNKLIINSEGNEDQLLFLKEYKNVQKIIIISCNEDITKELIDEIKLFAIVKVSHFIEGLDIEDYITDTKYILFNRLDESIIDQIYYLTLFSSFHYPKPIQLGKYPMLEIVNGNQMGLSGLINLKRIEYAIKLDCIPSSVTSLVFDEALNVNELLNEDPNCFKNIKNAEYQSDLCKQQKVNTLFDSFSNCEILYLQIYGIQVFTLPQLLRKLTIICNFKVEQLEEISKLKMLENLDIEFNNEETTDFETILSESDSGLVSQTLNKLPNLKKIKINTFNKYFILPTTLTSINIGCYDNATEVIDLSQYNSLKKIVVSSFVNVSLRLPNNIDTLKIDEGVTVLDSPTIRVNLLIIPKGIYEATQWDVNIVEFGQ